MHFICFIDTLIKDNILQIIPDNLDLFRTASNISEIRGKDGSYISSFDATFHALAVEQNALFLTADQKHYNKTFEKVGMVILLNQLRP